MNLCLFFCWGEEGEVSGGGGRRVDAYHVGSDRVCLGVLYSLRLYVDDYFGCLCVCMGGRIDGDLQALL